MKDTINIFPFKDDQYIQKHSETKDGEWFWGFDEELVVYFKGNIDELNFKDWTKLGTVSIPLDSEDIYVINELKSQFLFSEKNQENVKDQQNESLDSLFEDNVD